MLRCMDITFWNEEFIYKIYYEKDELSYYYCDNCGYITYIIDGDGKTCDKCIRLKEYQIFDQKNKEKKGSDTD